MLYVELLQVEIIILCEYNVSYMVTAAGWQLIKSQRYSPIPLSSSSGRVGFVTLNALAKHQAYLGNPKRHKSVHLFILWEIDLRTFLNHLPYLKKTPRNTQWLSASLTTILGSGATSYMTEPSSTANHSKRANQ